MSGGAKRSASRLHAKALANREVYADMPAPEFSRQAWRHHRHKAFKAAVAVARKAEIAGRRKRAGTSTAEFAFAATQDAEASAAMRGTN